MSEELVILHQHANTTGSQSGDRLVAQLAFAADPMGLHTFTLATFTVSGVTLTRYDCDGGAALQLTPDAFAALIAAWRMWEDASGECAIPLTTGPEWAKEGATA